MDSNSVASQLRKRVIFSAAIAGFTLAFFVGQGLLQKYELSFYYPFQSLSVVMVTLAALLFLKERITPQLFIGMILITLGAVLVSSS
jgi:uncharacterized membrane protein